ncbi:hypothetical protein [Ruegeria hyattellae]|uniref:hypothetical protein n=1 Tax=Ruegeria hyattellae TaxID=3233337 RepID=UPI00355B72C0
MTLDRRDVIKLGSALTVGTMLPSVALAATQNAAFEAQYDTVLERLRAAYGSLGYKEAPALPIATGDATYNGGLRHDFDQSMLPQGAFVVQPLARVADVGERARSDVLPLFHEVGCHPPADMDRAAVTRLMLRLLTQEFELDPARLALVSVPQSEEMRPVLDEIGLPFSEKVILRNAEEAFEARDGSGYFFPDPTGEDFFVTMGIYYRLVVAGDPAPAVYPPPANWTEIGEIVIAGDSAPPGLSIGAERLTLAVTGQYPSWDERLGALFAKVEAASAGQTPPDGLRAFE